MFLFFEGYGDHRDRPVRTPSFPTRRSSDLNTFKGATRTKQIFLVPTLKPVVTPASLIEQENGYGTRFGCHRHGHSSHGLRHARGEGGRSEEHTSDLQSLMPISYAVFSLQQTSKHRSSNV